VTSFRALATSTSSTSGKGARITALPAWQSSMHSGFAWPLLRSASSRSSVVVAPVGAFFSWAVTIPGVCAAQATSVSVTGGTNFTGHITTRSSRRIRAARECAAERGRWASEEEAKTVIFKRPKA